MGDSSANDRITQLEKQVAVLSGHVEMLTDLLRVLIQHLREIKTGEPVDRGEIQELLNKLWLKNNRGENS